MRTTTVTLTGVLASAAIALAAGCSGSGSSGMSTSLPSGATQTQSKARSGVGLERSGVAPQFLKYLTFGHAAPRPDKAAKPPKDLAVADEGTDAVEVLNKSYQLTSTITNGIDGPDGDYYDRNANLYVANYAAVNVTEYNKAESLIFTYSSGLKDPVDATADSSGNVYVADFGDFSASVVVEYPQGSNTPSQSCNTGLANEGVAVDKSGDVFVSGQNPNTGVGNIIEYTGGLSGCSGTTLGVTLGFAGGLQVDKNGNLAACDQESGADIIPPPYTSVSSTISSDCFHDALNKKDTLIFIAQINDQNVLVADYPSGTTVTTLGSSNGLSDPSGVATYPVSKK